MNIFKKFLAKKEEKESIEKFLCTLTDPQPCKKISWLGFFKSFKKDLKENRIGQIDHDYTVDDYVKSINKKYPLAKEVNNNFKELVNKPEYKNNIKTKHGTKEKGFEK